MAWDIGVGDDLIVPSDTFIASRLAVSYTGASASSRQASLAPSRANTLP